jgi:hypothetical protein
MSVWGKGNSMAVVEKRLTDLQSENVALHATVRGMTAIVQRNEALVGTLISKLDDMIEQIAELRLAKTVDATHVVPHFSSPSPVAKEISGLAKEKKGSEIIAMLYDKMPGGPCSQKLRPFYTDL